jgi:hypothetical protein
MDPSLRRVRTSSTINTTRRAPRLLRNLAEALELPAEPVAYHFAIQSVITALRRRRGDGPAVFAEMERLCWLDVHLIRAFPAAVLRTGR